MKSKSCEITRLESNILPDFTQSSEFYTISKDFQAGTEFTHQIMQDFFDLTVKELQSINTDSIPQAVIIGTFNNDTEIALLKIMILADQLYVKNLKEKS